MECAEDSDDLFLGDQALRFRTCLLRITLMIGENELDLGISKSRQPRISCPRQIQIVRVVYNIYGGFERMTGIRTNLRICSGERPDRPGAISLED